jgi:hypothetical protein
MSTGTVRITAASRRLLKELAEQTRLRMTEIIERALHAYERKLFFERLNQGYAELRGDGKAWSEHLAERKVWEATLTDGLDPDEHWTEEGQPRTGAKKGR